MSPGHQTRQYIPITIRNHLETGRLWTSSINGYWLGERERERERERGGGDKERYIIDISLDFEGASEGDACYMAPELMEGRFSPAADIFSLGISLFEVACDLQLPSNGEAWHMLRRGELPHEFIKGEREKGILFVIYFFSDLSPDLLSLLSQMMASDPFSRPSIGQLFKHKRLRIMELFEPAVRLKNRLVSNVNGELVILTSLS